MRAPHRPNTGWKERRPPSSSHRVAEKGSAGTGGKGVCVRACVQGSERAGRAGDIAAFVGESATEGEGRKGKGGWGVGTHIASKRGRRGEREAPLKCAKSPTAPRGKGRRGKIALGACAAARGP